MSDDFEKMEKLMSDKNLRAKMSIPQKIEIYGLWCVAKRGKCTRPQPSRLRPLDYGKWVAWRKYEHLSQEEAKMQFLAKAKVILSKL